MNINKLSEIFPPHKITWRVGAKDGDKGLALAYLDARAVMDRLDNVCGPTGWQCRYTHAGEKTVCEIGIWAGMAWIWKADGAGDTDIEGAKGAMSGAFKRAAVRWGIGRYLYSIKSPWVPLEKGRIAASAYDGLNKLLGGDEAHGPLGKQALKDAMRAFAGDLRDVSDETELIALMNSSEDLLSQCCEDLPSWWYGQEGSDVHGVLVRIDERREQLKGK
jgi:hypothetical protein